MKRMQFQPPTEHYDERIEAIDEEICSLMRQRKELSGNNPGFPAKNLINEWAKKYNFYEDFLNSVFSGFLYEEYYKPVVEPKRFLKNIPVLKSFEKDGVFYSVTFIRQFENASIVHLNMDRDDSNDEVPVELREHSFFDLSVEESDLEYDCRNEGGSGSRGHHFFTYIVSPALPDDISKLKLVFKEYKEPFRKPTGIEFII